MSHGITLDTATVLWTAGIGKREKEKVLLFETAGGTRLRVASNCPYETWYDGRFIGDGGHRCAPWEVLLDTRDARAAREVRLRLHYIHPRENIWHRCVFDDPFLADLDGNDWVCYDDQSVSFAAKVNSQLPRQNVAAARPTRGTERPLQHVDAASSQWRVWDSDLAPSRYVEVELRAEGRLELEGQRGRRFHPTSGEDIVSHVLDDRPADVSCATFDLGRIALHRFEITTQGPLALCYGEVPGFYETWATANRRKVRLADAVAPGAAGAAPFGLRGCRYVHVVHRAGQRFSLRVWRREYPLRWGDVHHADPTLDSILDACRNNLVACVDGGVVDTCWRERAQWTGDLRMSALALRALCENPEVARLALRQIATSYDEETAMVQGAWPIKRPGYRKLAMPTYHLAFCLTVLEQQGQDNTLREIVERSLRAWCEKYLRDGLLRDLPGWHFTDWDFLCPETHAGDSTGAHAVVNAWYHEACNRLGLPSIDLEAHREAFWIEDRQAYRLVEGGGPSVHATAAAICSLPHAEGISYLLDLDLHEIRRHVTPYFAYFVAKAIGTHSDEDMIRFITNFYGPIAQKYGTIYEKTTDEASLAHGWSVGVASLIAQTARSA